MMLPVWFHWLLAGLYLLIACACLVHALLDKIASGEGWTLHRLAGLCLCMLWPLTLLGIVLWITGKHLLSRRIGQPAPYALLSRHWRS